MDFEKGQICAIKSEGLNNSDTTIKVTRFKKVIANYLKTPDAYMQKKWPGRPPKLTPKGHRKLLCESFRAESSLKNLYLCKTLRRVRQFLNEFLNFEYKNRKAAPVLTKHRKQKREEWVKET